jgi:hypothetical protein
MAIGWLSALFETVLHTSFGLWLVTASMALTKSLITPAYIVGT